jgi:hypothetical protein
MDQGLSQILYIEDSDFCAPFAKLKTGDEAKVLLEVVLASSGNVPNFENVEGEPTERQKPFMQFVIKSVSTPGGKLLAENDEDELEEQIAKAKGHDGGFDADDMEKQIAAAKLGKGRDDEEITYQSDLKPAPATLLGDDKDMADLEDDISEIKGFARKRKRRR